VTIKQILNFKGKVHEKTTNMFQTFTKQQQIKTKRAIV